MISVIHPTFSLIDASKCTIYSIFLWTVEQ